MIIEADNLRLAEVLNFIQSDMDKYRISAEKQQNMIVAVEEIFSNIAQYAYGEKGNVEIITSMEDGIYTVTFCDEGKRYNPLKHRDMDLNIPPEKRPIGGLGIMLIKKFTDMQNYIYRDNCNIFTVGIKI